MKQKNQKSQQQNEQRVHDSRPRHESSVDEQKRSRNQASPDNHSDKWNTPGQSDDRNKARGSDYSNNTTYGAGSDSGGSMNADIEAGLDSDVSSGNEFISDVDGGRISTRKSPSQNNRSQQSNRS